MGKKQGQAQRTKGNIQPSSSAKAVEMLGQGASGFQAALDLTSNSLVGCTLNLLEEAIDPNMDSDFRTSFKKLSKRDAVTKLKGLEEIRSLTETKTLEECLTVLPAWCKQYTKLTIDSDRKTREVCQQTHEKICLKAQKNLAPHLKSIMPYWVMAQCDPYHSAGSKAQNAFKAVFSEKKQPEVLSFAKKEILNVIYHYLIVETIETLCDTKDEEAFQKYETIISMSLNALDLLVHFLDASSISELSDMLEKLFSDNKFWKLAKEKSSKIKFSFYCLLGVLFVKLSGDLKTKFETKMIPFVFYSCEEEEYACSTQIWSLIEILVAYEKTWELVKMKATFFPKLLSLIRQCNDMINQEALLNTILPIITHIPDQLVDENIFYKDLFEKLFDGFKKAKSKHNVKYSNKIIETLFTCLIYLVKKFESSNESLCLELNNRMCVGLLDEHFLNWDLSVSSVEANVIKLRHELYNYFNTCSEFLLKAKFFEQLDQQITKKLKKEECDETENIENLTRIVKNFTHLFNDKEYLKTNNNLNSILININENLIAYLIELKGNNELKLFKLNVINAITSLTLQYENWSLIEQFLSIENSDTKNISKELQLFSFQQMVIEFLSESNSILEKFAFTDLLISVKGCLGIQFGDVSVQEIFKHVQVNEFLFYYFDTTQSKKEKASSEKCAFLKTKLFRRCLYNILVKNEVIVTSIVKFFDSADLTINQKLFTNIFVLLKEFEDREAISSFTSSIVSCILVKLFNFLVSNAKNLFSIVESPFYDLLNQILSAYELIRETKGDKNNDFEEKFVVPLLINSIQVENKKLSYLKTESESDSEIKFKCSKLLFKIYEKSPSIIVNHMKREFNNYQIDDIILITSLIVSNCADLNSSVNIMKMFCDLVDIQFPFNEFQSNFDYVLCQIYHLSIDRFLFKDNLQEVEESVLNETTLLKVLYQLKAYNFVLNKYDNIDTIKQILSFNEINNFFYFLVKNSLICSGVNVSIKNESLQINIQEAFHSFLQHVLSSGLFYDIFSKKLNKLDLNVFFENGKPNLDLFSYCIRFLKNEFINFFNESEEEKMKAIEKLHNTALALAEIIMNEEKEENLKKLLKMQLNNLDFIEVLFKKENLNNTEELSKHLNKLYAEIKTSSLFNAESPINTKTLSTELLSKINRASFNLNQISRLVHYFVSNTSKANLENIDPIANVLIDVLNLLMQINLNELFDNDKNDNFWVLACFKDKLNIFFGQIFNVSTLDSSVLSFAKYLNEAQWDFLLIYISNQVQNYANIKKYTDILFTQPKSQIIFTSMFDLLSALCSFMTNALNIKLNIANVEKLINEWNEFFSKEIFDPLLKFYINVCSALYIRNVTTKHGLRMISSLSKSISYIPYERVINNTLDVNLNALDFSKLIKYKLVDTRIQTAFNSILPNLSHSHSAIQMSSFVIMEKLMSEIYKCYTAPKTEESSVEGESKAQAEAMVFEEHIFQLLPSIIVEILERNKKIFVDVKSLMNFDQNLLELSSYYNKEDLELLGVDEMKEFKILSNPEFTKNSFNNVLMSYLFIKKLIITMLSKADLEFKVKLISDLRECNFYDDLLNVIFRVIPSNPTMVEHYGKYISLLEFNEADVSYYFDNNAKDFTNFNIEAFGCNLLKYSLKNTPALIRDWWNSQKKSVADYVDKYLSQYVSPILLSNEVKYINEHSSSVDWKTSDVEIDEEYESSIKVKANINSREIVTQYKVKELNMELVITLPSNYPLGSIDLSCLKRLGVSENEWRKWLLQLTTYLMHRNGDIIESLKIWKRNVDKNFSGVEECTICYCIIHGTNYQLPKMKCRTCRKKFHSLCLYKWFESSSKSTCPLCRNLF